MQQFFTFVLKPYREKGIVIGAVDTVVKVVALAIWGYLAYILSMLFLDSLLIDYNPLNKMWWFSYCFIMFFGATWLAYILLFVRDYNEE